VATAAQFAAEAGTARLRPAGRAGSGSQTAAPHAARIRAPHLQRAACRPGFGTRAA